jgi:hypothetical protein
MATTRFPNPITTLYNPAAWAEVDVPVVSGGAGGDDDNLTATSPSATQKLGGNLTTGTETIGESITTGAIQIGNSLTSGGITMGATTAGTGAGFVQVGSDNLPYNYIRSLNLLLNTNNSGSTAIGWINNALSTYGIVDLYGDIQTYGISFINNITMTGGGVVQNIVGDSTNEASLSTTFNRKSTATLGYIQCYSLVKPDQYSSGYFELTVCGSNQNSGGFAYKCFFSISDTTATAVSTLFQSGGTFPLIRFSGTAPIIISIDTSKNAAGTTISTSQTFVATLVAYPSITITNVLQDYSVAAM